MFLKIAQCKQFVMWHYAQNLKSCKIFISQPILMKFVGNFMLAQDLYSAIGFIQICWVWNITLWYLLLEVDLDLISSISGFV